VKVDARDDAGGIGIVAKEDLRRGIVGRVRRAKLQEGRFRGRGSERDLIARRQPPAYNDLPVDGYAVPALQIADAPTVRLTDDFSVFAGEVGRVENQVADHAAANDDAGLLERSSDSFSGDLKDQ
jgi:molybdopterin biosynthesis enzyme